MLNKNKFDNDIIANCLYYRHRIQSGLTQFFNVQGGKNLKCRAYIKVLNLPHGKMSVSVKLMSAISTHGKF